jgi:hypothetical protein
MNKRQRAVFTGQLMAGTVSILDLQLWPLYQDDVTPKVDEVHRPCLTKQFKLEDICPICGQETFEDTHRGQPKIEVEKIMPDVKEIDMHVCKTGEWIEEKPTKKYVCRSANCVEKIFERPTDVLRFGGKDYLYSPKNRAQYESHLPRAGIMQIKQIIESKIFSPIHLTGQNYLIMPLPLADEKITREYYSLNYYLLWRKKILVVEYLLDDKYPKIALVAPAWDQKAKVGLYCCSLHEQNEIFDTEVTIPKPDKEPIVLLERQLDELERIVEKSIETPRDFTIPANQVLRDIVKKKKPLRPLGQQKKKTRRRKKKSAV